MLGFYGSTPLLHPYLCFCHLYPTSHNYVAHSSDGIENSFVTVTILDPPNVGKYTLINMFCDMSINKTYRL